MKLFSIKKASDLLGVTAESLRNWEDQGLLLPQKTPGGHRRYRLEDLEKLNATKNDVKLSEWQRQVLSNQFRILSCVDKEHSYEDKIKELEDI